jgi:hypothetical protein
MLLSCCKLRISESIAKLAQAMHIVMLKFAVKREQSQACLSYAEREQIEQKLTCFSICPRRRISKGAR